MELELNLLSNEIQSVSSQNSEAYSEIVVGGSILVKQNCLKFQKRSDQTDRKSVV